MSLLNYCARCGQHIVNVHVYAGKTYGGDCVEVVSGVRRERWELRRLAGVSDPATAHERALEMEARRERNRAEWEAAEAARDANRARFAPVLDMLAEAGLVAAPSGLYDPFDNQWLGSVASDMRDGAEVSERCVRIVCEIYGKTFGRKGSNKYWEAYEALAALFDTTK